MTVEHGKPGLVIPGPAASRNPTAFAGLQTRTPQAARSASAKDGASQSVLSGLETDSGFVPSGRLGMEKGFQAGAPE